MNKLDLGFIVIQTKKQWRFNFHRYLEMSNQLEKIEEKVKNVSEANTQLGIDNVYLGQVIDDQKKEITKLKTLLTKNKIDYKKIYKKGEK